MQYKVNWSNADEDVWRLTNGSWMLFVAFHTKIPSLLAIAIINKYV